MKISNKKNIETRGLYLLVTIPIILFMIICYYMIIKELDLIVIILTTLVIAIIIFLNTLRYKEFENSGYVITIAQKHPLFDKRFKLPALEFPVNLIKDFHTTGNIIYFTIDNNGRKNEKTHVLKFILSGFNDLERRQIIISLSETIKNN